MLNLTQLETANQVARRLKDVREKIALLTPVGDRKPALGVAIQGRYDDRLEELCLPVVREELYRQERVALAELAQLGVDGDKQ